MFLARPIRRQHGFESGLNGPVRALPEGAQSVAAGETRDKTMLRCAFAAARRDASRRWGPELGPDSSHAVRPGSTKQIRLRVAAGFRPGRVPRQSAVAYYAAIRHGKRFPEPSRAMCCTNPWPGALILARSPCPAGGTVPACLPAGGGPGPKRRLNPHAVPAHQVQVDSAAVGRQQ
jgi:hypothetical protein